MTFKRSIGLVLALATLALVAARPADAACPACGGSSCTISGSHTINSGETCNYAGQSVTLTGTFTGDNNAACYIIIADNFTLRGTLRARGSCIDARISNLFKMEVVSNSASLVDVRNADSAGDGFFLTCGSAQLDGNGVNGDADGDQSPFYFPAADVDIACTGNITGTGGSIHVNATGGDDGGTISTVSSEGLINLTSAQHANGGGEFSFGGAITVDAALDATVGGANRSLEAQSSQGGFAGEVSITSGEDATVNGTINVNGNGEDSDGGLISVDAETVTTGTTWNARSDQGGDGGFIDVFALSGAGTVTTTAGAASWNVQGSSFHDDGGDGGGIAVSAIGDVSLTGDMDAAGVGEIASGGDIDIGTDGDITTAATSRIEADSTGTDASDGFVTMTGCSMTISGDVDTRNTSLDSGTNTFDYAGSFLQNSGSNILADDDGGNDVFCRCPDTSPADGSCDSATCVSPPTFNGTVTPAANVIPVIRAACS